VQTSITQLSFTFNGLTVWNDLPSALCDSSLSSTVTKQCVTNFRWAVSLSGFAQWKQAAECKLMHFFKWSWNYRSTNCLVLWKL